MISSKWLKSKNPDPPSLPTPNHNLGMAIREPISLSCDSIKKASAKRVTLIMAVNPVLTRLDTLISSMDYTQGQALKMAQCLGFGSTNWLCMVTQA